MIASEEQNVTNSPAGRWPAAVRCRIRMVLTSAPNMNGTHTAAIATETPVIAEKTATINDKNSRLFRLNDQFRRLLLSSR